MLVLSSNKRAFHFMLNQQNYIVHILLFKYAHLSFLSEQWKCCTQGTQLFLFPFLTCTHSINTLYHLLTDDKKGRTEVEADTPILWPPDAKTHCKRPWCWERLRAGGEREDRGWDGWMASRSQWIWVWVNSWSWWWTGRPGVLQSMGLQRVRHNWTEMN